MTHSRPISSPTSAALAARLPALTALLIAAGCLSPSPSPAPTAVPTPAALPPPAADEIVWAVEKAPASLDPARLAFDPARMAFDPAATMISAQVYDRLLRFRPGTVQLAPGIAADWEADVENNTFTFTLRDGLRFHDGTPLDATAIVWNFERWMNPDHPAHHDGFKAWQQLFGGFTGQQDAEGRPIALISRVDALDPRTVRFTLNAPFTPFLHHLALLPVGFASPSAVSAQGADYASDSANLPVGSGPFRVVRWSAEGTVQLAPFEDYWAGPPSAPGLRFVPLGSSEARAAAVAEGRAHGTELVATTPVTGVLASAAVTVQPRPAHSTAWLMLNHSREPLDDVRVRRAIGLAIDRVGLAREAFGPYALPADQMLPPGFLGRDPTIETAYDPAQAEALLAEAGRSDGFPLHIWVANAKRQYLPDPIGAAEAVAEMLRAVGIDAQVRSESLRRFLDDRDSGRFSAWIIGWEAQSPDPDNFWFYHFGAGRLSPEGQYQNPGLADALRRAQRTLGTEQRLEIYRQAARTVHDDVARVFLAHARPLVATSPRLRGYEPHPLRLDSFADVSLAPASAGPTTAPVTSATPVAPSGGSATTTTEPEPGGDATAAPTEPSSVATTTTTAPSAAMTTTPTAPAADMTAAPIATETPTE